MANSFRLMQRFWLDLEKPDEYELAESIQVLKDERSFSRAVRQGLRLWMSLRQRDTSVLFELFPWIADALQGTTAGKTGDSGSGGLEDEIKALQAKIDLLTDLQTQQSIPANGIQAAAQAAQKQLPAPDEYTEPEIIITRAKTDDDNRSDWNFAISSAATVYGSFDALPPKILEYGLRTGRIQPHQVDAPPKTKSAKSVKPAKSKGQPVVLDVKESPAGPKAMDVPQFAAPQIDLDNIQW